jgi:hypothetical protein
MIPLECGEDETRQLRPNLSQLSDGTTPALNLESLLPVYYIRSFSCLINTN